MPLQVAGVSIRMPESATTAVAGTPKMMKSSTAAAAAAAAAGPTPQDNLRKTARTLFCLAYAALWCALTSHGWQRAEFQGEREIDGKTYHQSVVGQYGLYDVQFEGTGETLNVPYVTWGLAQTDLPQAYPLVMAAAACIALAAGCGGLVFLAHLRAVCTRSAAVTAAYTRWSARAAIPQCVFTALGAVAWRCVPPQAFNVFCTRDGCVKEDAAGVRALSVWYAWVFALVSAVIALFLALTLWRLAHFDDDGHGNKAGAAADEEVEIPLSGASGGVIHAPHPTQPHRTLQTARSPAVMGAAAPSPRTAAEAWDPQIRRQQYAPVQSALAGMSPGRGKGKGKGKGTDGVAADPNTPSWLHGV